MIKAPYIPVVQTTFALNLFRVFLAVRPLIYLLLSLCTFVDSELSKGNLLVAARETVKLLNASTMLPQIMKNKSNFGIQAHPLLAKCRYTCRYKVHCVFMAFGI